MTQPPNNIGIWKTIAPQLCQGIGHALSNACSAPWEALVADEPFSAHPDLSETVCLRLVFEGALSGSVALLIRTADVVSFGIRTSQTDVSVLPNGATGALLGAFERSTAWLSESLISYGHVSVRVEHVTDLHPPKEPALELWIEGDEPRKRVSVHLLFDPVLLASLRSCSSNAFSYPTGGAVAQDTNIGLVMDVELNVTLRFGQRQLSLREVLDLTSGSVVELDRQVDEPVELVLDGRVLARGEAVIIDGNYGIRISEVVQTVAP